MDYEKAYKKMAQRVKELHEAGNALTKMQMEIICPELAESEDERIRKKIIESAKEYYKEHYKGENPQGRGVVIQSYCDGALAYFEKQKEQKPIKVLYIPKFREGDVVVSTKNPRLTYQILRVGYTNELGNPEYKVEIFTDGKSDEPRNIKYIEVAKMDDWGNLLSRNQRSGAKRMKRYEEILCPCLSICEAIG